MNIISVKCPKCHSTNLYRFGKDPKGFQKYQCKDCKRQFAPDSPLKPRPKANHPTCPVCGKASFLHHDYKYYSNYRCGIKSCYHSFFVAKTFDIDLPSSMAITGKIDFKRMRFPLHIVLTALNLFYLSNVTTRKISLFLKQQHNVKVSHVSISKWIIKFAPIFSSIASKLSASYELASSDEWHVDETVVKIDGHNYYLWLAIDSETRFVIDFHLSPFRDSDQAHSILANMKRNYGSPKAIVSDRLWSYEMPIKTFHQEAQHIQVKSFQDDITNNVIEAFNGQFKAWYKTKRGFASFNTANALISLYVFAYNFIRPHSALSGLTPAEVVGGSYKGRDKQFWFLAS